MPTASSTPRPDGSTSPEVSGAASTENQSEAPEVSRLPPLRADSTLEAAITSFHEYMVRKGFSDNTIKAFRNDLKIVQNFLGADTKLHQVSTQHLHDFLEWLQHARGKPCSAKTLARRITTLKVFFGWVHGIGVIGTDPAEPVVQQPARTPLPTILRDDEISKLSRAAQDYLWDRNQADARPYVLVNLLLQTGMKKAECASLLISDINLTQPQSPEVTVRYPEERHAHKNRSVILHPGIVPALNQYLEQYKPEHHLFECTPRNLEYVLDEVGHKAGIHRLQVGFETLRWTCAVRDYRTGVPEERLRQKMGLSKISWRETREKIFQLAGR
ncbi:MAG: site-specific integrase [Chloroflexi bacterium]|nr:site-specific integrase [Chloroflexota bacterium]